jgi:sugar (pentulose or hexulose) kinase
VTGFGADGAPFGPDGTQRYPVISWHDSRAADDLAAIADQVGERVLYDLTGYHCYPINTLCRWRWLGRNAPEALVAAGGPVFLSDEEAAAIDKRLDEHFRRAMLASDRA